MYISFNMIAYINTIFSTIFIQLLNLLISSI